MGEAIGVKLEPSTTIEGHQKIGMVRVFGNVGNRGKPPETLFLYNGIVEVTGSIPVGSTN
jgi:hypothetical protein